MSCCGWRGQKNVHQPWPLALNCYGGRPSNPKRRALERAAVEHSLPPLTQASLAERGQKVQPLQTAVSYTHLTLPTTTSV